MVWMSEGNRDSLAITSSEKGPHEVWFHRLCYLCLARQPLRTECIVLCCKKRWSAISRESKEMEG